MNTGSLSSRVDGPTRMNDSNTTRWQDVAADTILMLEVWEDINYLHGYPRADMPHAWWINPAKAYGSNTHNAQPLYINIDMSVQSTIYSTLQESQFTRDGSD